MSTFRFPLLAKVKDMVSGFEGMVTARSESVGYGAQYLVVQKGGKKVEDEWFPEARLSSVEGENEDVAEPVPDTSTHF